MPKILIARSTASLGDRYLYAYSDELVSEAKSRGWTVFLCEEKNCNRIELLSRLDKTSPELVIFNGHGDDDALYGYDGSKAIDTGSSGVLRGKIFFARACGAVKGLGKAAVGKGCKAFIGYSDYFMIPYVYGYEATPLRDPAAKPVLEISNLVAKRLLKHLTVSESIGAAKKKASELMFEMLTSGEPYDSPAFKAAYQNHFNLEFAGDPQAKA